MTPRLQLALPSTTPVILYSIHEEFAQLPLPEVF